MKHVFIIDSKSFRDIQWRMDSLLDSIGQYFRTQEKPNFSTLFSHYPRDAMEFIEKQAQEAEEGEIVRVYAVGGDEILFDCLNAVAELPNAELAIMPYGPVNNFIRSFGEGKADLFKDIQAMAEAPAIPTDIIKIGNNFAINGCAVGFSPEVAMKMRDFTGRLTERMSRFSTILWLFLSNVITLLNKTILTRRYTITVDDQEFNGNYSQIFILNGPYFGRKQHALKGVSPNDGLLNVVIFNSIPLLPAFISFKKYKRGKIPSNCVCLQGKKITIKSEKPMQIQSDTELFLETSLTMEIIPGIMPVVAVNNLTYQGT
ncbi:MAG TPA: hypothetical protein DEQ14_02210 [Treponema sp.]|nr:hypothetical protein [Treponema sp.]